MDEDDFDFKRMIEQLSDPEYVAQATAAISASSNPLSKTNSFLINSMGTLSSSPSGASPSYAASSLSSGPASGPSTYSVLHPSVEQIKREMSWSIGSNSGMNERHNRTNSIGGSSSGGNEIGTRLRAASDMFQRGLISNEQKAVMKSLVLTRDPTFLEEFEKSQKTRDTAPLRALLNARQKEMSITTGVIDNVNFNDMNLGKDRSGSTSSIGQIFDFGLSRKRNASTSTPIIRSHKSIAASSGIDQVRIPTLDTNFGPVLSQNTFANPSTLSGPAFKRNGDTSTSPATQKNQKSHKAQNDTFDEEEDETLDEQSAKFKKNERERRRRAALSNGFDALSKLLKIPPDAKLDKTAILQHAVVRISQLQQQVERLEGERDGLVAALQQRPYQSSNNF